MSTGRLGEALPIFQVAYLRRAASQPSAPLGVTCPEPPTYYGLQAAFTLRAPVKRSSTALLEALSNTVGKDPTAAPYGFIDDPALTPLEGRWRGMSRFSPQKYYLSKDFGRRAARTLAQEWPSLFMFDRDKPMLPAFRPQKPRDPASIVELLTLEKEE